MDMITIAAGLITRTAAIEMTARCISAIATSAGGIKEVSKFISETTHHSGDLGDTLTRLDIEASVDVLDKLVKDIRLTKHSEALTACLANLKDVLHKIHAVMLSIQTKIQYNGSIWLKWWAKNFDDELKKIVSLHTVMESRRKLFFDVLSVDTHFVSEESMMIIRDATGEGNSNIKLLAKSVNMGRIPRIAFDPNESIVIISS